MALVLTAASGCQRSPDEPALQATSRQPIVNGTADPQSQTLSDGQILAIGWLHPRFAADSNFCTATLITPNVVVTAQHCVGGWSPSDIAFGVGDTPSDPETSFNVTAIAAHPSRDMALLVLEEDATSVLPAIVPIPANTEAITSDDIGTALDAAGYGETYDTNPRGRWFALVYLDEVDEEEIIVDGRGEQGICYGDSGGPVIWTGDAGPVVLAVESWGDSSCVDRDHMTRLDTLYDDFITPILNGELPPDPCEGIGSDGVCEGEVLKWCRRGTLRERDCSSFGSTCEFIDPEVGYGCTCGDLGYTGRCNGNVVEYCDEDRIRAVDCSFREQSCGYIDEETGYACVDGTPACGPGTEDGICQGTVLVTCNNGVTLTRNCAGDDLSCVQDGDGARCAEDEPVESDPEPDLGGDPEPDVPNLPNPSGPDGGDVSPGQGGGGSAEDGCSQSGAAGLGSPLALALFAMLAAAVRRRTQA